MGIFSLTHGFIKVIVSYMSKKLEGLFGLKLGEVFDEKKFKTINKEFVHDEYHVEIDWPPQSNILFKDYAVRCSKNMIISGISANTLSPILFDDAKERQEDLENYFIQTYFDNYAIYYWDLENFWHSYEFIPYNSKVIPLRKDYRNYINPDEPTKTLTITIFGESDKYKQVELLLELKHDAKEEEPSKVYEEEDIKTFDTGKGYEIDVTGL